MDTFTTQFLHLRLKDHCRRRGVEIVRACNSLNYMNPIGETFWERLGGIALLEKVCY